MSTIKATMEPDPDGTLHLPLPPELRHGPINVTATLEPAEPSSPAKDSPEPRANLKGFGCLRGKIWMADDFDEPLDDFKDYME
ncbi:MAG TPA: DUF2281 domain-containing protein [Tepidisphaeraceae bacterium]|jgi:hypothetical protein|nr:DUF2281 domain-containing protein [Tepidisphaeraceae bacterium]